MLTLDKAQNDVRYIQATFAENNLIVQLGLENDNQTRLVEKICKTGKECKDIFYQFYDFGPVENIDPYVPVQF